MNSAGRYLDYGSPRGRTRRARALAAIAILYPALTLLAGACAHPPPPPVQPAVVAPEPSPPADKDWNIFPDPMTGRVEVYHQGEYVGSVTGEESEDPPTPRKRPSAGTEPD